MKRSTHYIPIIILFLIPAFLLSQEDIAIGEWKAYVPFNESYHVAQSDKYLYSAAERGILKVNKSDHSIEKITKVNGLSDTEATKLVFDPLTKTLVIGYANGNIDLMTAEGVVNIPNIFTNSNIVVVKSPNRSRVDDNGKAYLAYNFGLVQLDLESFTFGFSLRTSFEIFDFVKFNGKFFFSSAEGIYWADANPNINHADLSTWNRFELGWPDEYFSKSIAALGDHLYCDVNGDLMEIIDDQPILIKEKKENYFVRTISPLQNTIAVSFAYIDPNPPVFKIDELYFIDENGQDLAEYTTLQCAIVIENVIQDGNGRIYYSNTSSLKFFNEIGGGCSDIKTPGPPSTDAFEIAFLDQEVLVATGEVADNSVGQFSTKGLYLYKDQTWDQFNHADGFFGDSVKDYTEVAVGPNGQIAIGTYFEGVMILSPDRTEVKLYTDNNSCLEPQSFPVTTISDLTYDARGDLWISNFRSENPLKMIDRDGVCHSFPISRSFGTGALWEIAIDEQGYKWISDLDGSIGAIVFDEGDLEDPSDDRFRVLNASNSALEDNKVWDIKTDLDGDIWLGTDQGVVVFECTASIFSTGCNGRRPIVEVEGVPALLLENERVRAIAIDGANRKWFGTNNGIFVQSPNGEEEVLRFEERNSPLISNLVRDIAINPKTGEVFISTDKGIMSYRTDATNGDETIHEAASEVFAFPNPVRPNYDGPIAIKGLPRDARVKITDVQGKLVFEGEANGGEAIWNGQDYNGRRAASGIYLVFTTSQSAFEKPDALVSKILIVN